MTRLGELLRKQGHFLLQNDSYALIYIAILALIPFAAWLSAAVVALITLRKGWVAGLKGLVIGIVSLYIPSLVSDAWSMSFTNAVLAFLPCYLTAGVLRSTMSWRIAMAFIVLLMLCGINYVYWLAPELIQEQYQFVVAILKQWQNSDLVSNQEAVNAVNPMIVTYYVIGVQAISIALSAIVSLMLARSVQSGLFYPGGYRQEMLDFRASGWGVILLALAVVGAYQGVPLAISCLPILVMYYAGAGISLSFNILAKGKKGVGVVFLLLIPLIIVPLVMLPIYVILGALDSLFNFRLYLSAKKGGKTE